MLKNFGNGLLALLTGVLFAIVPATVVAASEVEIDELFDLEELVEDEFEEELGEEELEEELDELEEEFEEEKDEDEDDD